MSGSAIPHLSSLLAQLFSPGLDPVTFRSRTATILRDLGECQVISFAKLHPTTRQLDIDFDPFFPALGAALEGFGRHMAKYPCFNFDPTVAGGRPFLRGDFLSDAEFHAAPVYREGFQLAGISDHAAMLLPSMDFAVFFLGLEKTDGATFRAEHRARLGEIQPHLANAHLLAQAFTTLDHAATDPAVFARLGFTPRESETLALVATGKSNAEVGTILGLSLPTVKGHVAAIFDKLGVDNRHAAILRAQQLIRPTPPPAPPTTRRASTVAAR